MSTVPRHSKLGTALRRLRRSDYWFPNITPSDLKFIGVLWSSEFIRPWVQVWAENPLENINTSNFYKTFYINSLVLKVAITIAVSIVVDLRNHKFFAYFLSLIVFAIGIIFGAVAAFVQNDRLYVVPLGLCDSLFLTYPTKFYLIFNQRPNASASETCVVVALFELVNSSSLITLYIILYSCHETFSQAVTIVFWIIYIVLTSGLMWLTIFVRRYATEEVIKESNIPQVLIGIRQDVVKNPGDSSEITKRKTVRVQRFIAFVLLLLPILVITSFEVTLTIIVNSFNLGKDSSGHVHKFLAKLVIIPVIGLLFSGAKGFLARVCGLLLIAAAHIFNTIVILLIAFYLNSNDTTIDKRQLIEDSNPTNIIVISGHLPNSERAVVRVFGATDTLFIVESPTYTSQPDKTVEFEVDVKQGPISLEMKIRKIGRSNEKKFTVEVEANKRYWFLLATSKDDAFIELIRVFGVDEIWTSGDPKLYLLNGDKKEPADPSKFYVTDKETDERTSYKVPRPNMAASIVLKQSPHKYNFRYGKSTTNTDYVKLSPYSENAAVMYKYDKKDRLRFHTSVLEIRHGKPITTQEPPSTAQPVTGKTTTQQPPSTQQPVTGNINLLQASYALSGLTSASTNVGYLHFFWMESPARLKTTLLACFLVINEVVGELTKLIIESFSVEKAIVCLAMSCCAGVLHITLGLYYDSHFSSPPPPQSSELTEDSVSKGSIPKGSIPEEPPAPDLGVSPSRSVGSTKLRLPFGWAK